jgi:Protein of unknown function (DUF992)
MIKTLLLSAAAFLAVSALPAAAAQGGVELGVLDCSIGAGTGFIIGSKKDLHCTFKPAGKTFAPENYFGSVRKWGIDIGSTKQGVMSWLVLAPSTNIYAPGGLAGDYVGASAEATAAVGAGANLLVGGMNGTFALQPLSVQTQTGLNVAVGVTSFQLRSTEN